MNILVVEDSQSIRNLLANKIKEWGQNVIVAKNGREAWEKLKASPIDVVVTDWIMPEMDGLELCRRIRRARFKHYIYIIFVTVRDSKQDKLGALASGADDYLTKPIDFDELKARLEIGFRIVLLEKDISKKYNQIKKNYFQTIRMFTNLVEVFDKDLGKHSRRVADLSIKMAAQVAGVNHHDVQIIEAAALLHDVGMVGLPNEVLLKSRTEMTGEEKDFFLSHPVRGELILKGIEFLQPIATIVRTHHEQYNGLGFPDGLTGDEIPLFAKIISAASVYDNLIYRGKIPLEDIPDRMERLRGYQLDPVMVDILLRNNLEQIQKEKGQRFIETDIDALKGGMMLAEDVRMKRGALVMAAETKLTTHDIKKLLSYEKSNCINNQIRVYKASKHSKGDNQWI
jgi:putative nucleotidyltransferase with HDIG domain